MKAIKLFSMAVAALMMAACSNEDNDVQQPAQQARMIPFKATIGPAEGGTRTTITEGTGSDAGKLMVAWKGGETIALVHNGTKDEVQVTTVNPDGSAVIEGSIDNTGTDGEDVVLVYPADAVASVTSGTTYVPNTDAAFLAIGFQQDGTLTYIGNNLDAREGSGTLKISGGTATLNNNVTMESKIAVWKLTLTTDGTTPLAANQVTLSIGTNPIAATAVNATGKSEWTLCVVPATLALYSGDFTISAKVGTDTYTYTKAGGVSLATSKYYQSTVTMAKTDPDYLKWDGTQKKLVATEIPTDATAVSNASGNVNWAAGTYVVVGDVTISGVISLQGAVNLIIKDGAKLTVGKIDGANYDLSIFGQSNMTGELVVRHNTLHAIQNLSTLEIHSCKVTAIGVLNARYGFNDIGTINVYGGSVDAKATGGTGDGICLRDAGSMNIYGGLVKAEGKGSFNNYCYGVEGSATITVYGGKLWAGSPNKQAFRSNVTLTTGASFTGKIQTSDDNTTWTDWTTDGTPTTKYVKVE